jgi:hypothetical protein
MQNENITKAYLNQYVFYGLSDLNEGFDADTIYYFSETEFLLLLDRVEQLGLGIHGIEPWSGGNYFDCETFESYKLSCTDPKWYRTAFKNIKSKADKNKMTLDWSATYFVPEEILEDYKVLMT